MKEDRFLTVILVVIALLVVTSLVVFFIKEDSAVYLPDDAPENIVHNYILAIGKGEYARAYDYLSEKGNKPSYDDFEENFLFSDIQAGYKIGKTTISTDLAYVELTIMETSGGLFFDRYDYAETARLVKESGGWRIIQMPYAYWAWDWYEEKE